MAPNELEVQREQFHRELMRKSMRIAELELVVRAIEARYERSMSWRLTRPLRIVARVRQTIRAKKPA